MSFLNPKTRTVVVNEILSAAQAIAEKHGMSVNYTGGTYDDATFATKITFEFPDVAKQKAQQEGEQYGPMLGLPKDVIGMTYTHRGSTFKVVGLNPRRPKNSVELEEVGTGKKYKCAASYLKLQLGIKATDLR